MCKKGKHLFKEERPLPITFGKGLEIPEASVFVWVN